jgi:WD40 repeat protein
MRIPYADEFGGVLAAPTRRQRRGDVASMAGAVLVIALAAAAVIMAVHRPPVAGLVATLSGPGGQATCSAAFSPDGKTLAVAGCTGSVSLWDVATRRWIATLASGRCPDGGQVMFSPDGTTLALFSGSDPTACVWEVAARRETTLTDPGPRARLAFGGTGGAFSPGGTTLAVTGSNGNIYLWDLATRRVTATVPAPKDCSQGCPIAFSPDGTTLAVGEAGGLGERIYLWDLAARRWTATLSDASANNADQVNGLAVNSLAFSRDGILAAGDVNGRVYLWDAATRRLTAAIGLPINMAQGNAFISKDGQPYPMPGAFGQAVDVVFSPDGTIVAANVNFGYGTYLYDVATRKRVATLTDPGGQPQTAPVVFSPDGTMLAVTDSNGRTYLWRLPQPLHGNLRPPVTTRMGLMFTR